MLKNHQLGGNPKIGVSTKWMVKIMENPIKMDDLGGKPPIFGNTQLMMDFYSQKSSGLARAKNKQAVA